MVVCSLSDHLCMFCVLCIFFPLFVSSTYDPVLAALLKSRKEVSQRRQRKHWQRGKYEGNLKVKENILKNLPVKLIWLLK
jgi:hypothetical protein